jgi:hypothetical protein
MCVAGCRHIVLYIACISTHACILLCGCLMNLPLWEGAVTMCAEVCAGVLLVRTKIVQREVCDGQSSYVVHMYLKVQLCKFPALITIRTEQ